MTKGIEVIKELRYIVLKFCEDNNKQNAYCIELCDTIKQALLKAQELESKNNALLEENNDLYAELTLANKQYKELIESTKQYQKVLDIIKSKARFYDNNTKCKIEIEADDFNSSEEWEQVERWILNNDNSR